MESVLFLGTSGGAPTKDRYLPSLMIKLRNGKYWLVDCGDGTQYHFVKNSGCKISKVDTIFITHLHSDHLFGIPGLLSLISLKKARTRPLVLVGPVGLKCFIECAIKVSCTHLCFPIQFVEFEAIGGKECYNLETSNEELLAQCKVPETDCGDSITISVHPLSHAGMPSFGYVFSEPDKVSVIPEKIAKLDGFDCKKNLPVIKDGGAVVLPGGRVVFPDDVLGIVKGKKVVILGDSLSPEDGGILKEAADCDVVVHECTFSDEEKSIAVEGGHSTAGMAGNFAKLVKAQALILTHFSKRNEGAEDKLLEEAIAGTSGCGTKVILAYDYGEYSLKHKKFK